MCDLFKTILDNNLGNLKTSQNVSIENQSSSLTLGNGYWVSNYDNLTTEADRIQGIVNNLTENPLPEYNDDIIDAFQTILGFLKENQESIDSAIAEKFNNV